MNYDYASVNFLYKSIKAATMKKAKRDIAPLRLPTSPLNTMSQRVCYHLKYGLCHLIACMGGIWFYERDDDHVFRLVDGMEARAGGAMARPPGFNLGGRKVYASMRSHHFILTSTLKKL